MNRHYWAVMECSPGCKGCPGASITHDESANPRAEYTSDSRDIQRRAMGPASSGSEA